MPEEVAPHEDQENYAKDELSGSSFQINEVLSVFNLYPRSVSVPRPLASSDFVSRSGLLTP